MSEIEHRVGKLIPVKIETSMEETCKSIIRNMNIEKEDYHETYEECLGDEFYGSYVIIDDKLFRVEEEEINPYADIFIAEINEDGTYNFTVKYYNGGCSFNEVMGIAMDRLNKLSND